MQRQWILEKNDRYLVIKLKPSTCKVELSVQCKLFGNVKLIKWVERGSTTNQQWFEQQHNQPQ